MSKVYYNHTTKQQAVKRGFAPAATIALQRVGNEFHYGITICSKYDNPNKATGREIALARMNQGFRKTAIPEALLKNDSTGDICLTFLYQLSASVSSNHRKWKNKITKFNKGREESARIVASNVTKISVKEQQPA